MSRAWSLANGAAIAASGVPEGGLVGAAIQEVIGAPKLFAALVDGGYHLPVSEITFERCAVHAETMPPHEAGGRVAGAVMTLHAPSRMGERLSALQNYNAGGFEGDSRRVARDRAVEAARGTHGDGRRAATDHGRNGTGKGVAGACLSCRERPARELFLR